MNYVNDLPLTEVDYNILELVKQAYKDSGKTQTQIAQSIGVSREIVHRILKGRKRHWLRYTPHLFKFLAACDCKAVLTLIFIDSKALPVNTEGALPFGTMR